MTLHNIRPSSRRDILALGAATGVLRMLGTPEVAFGAEHNDEADHVSLSVRAFGAAGDASADDTAAFQRALDAAHTSGGGVVYAPPGRYLFKGMLTIPDGVGLRGTFGYVPSHGGFRDHGQPKPGDDGSALFVTAGRGSEDGRPFLTLNTNSAVSGLSFYYPEQVSDGNPVPYPWTIAMRGKNPAAFDLELLNPYQGIDASQNERHNIRNITGQPLRRNLGRRYLRHRPD